MLKKIVKWGALVIVSLTGAMMCHWFGWRAVIGLVLALSAFTLHIAIEREEEDEALMEETVAALMQALEEEIKKSNEEDK